MVRTTSDKQISRTFQWFFKDNLQFSRSKIYLINRHFLTPYGTHYWLKHVIFSGVIYDFFSSAMVDHIILKYFLQPRLGKWLGMTCNGPFARWRRLLPRPESFRVLLSSADKDFCFVNVAGITKFKYERTNERESGRSSKMTPSCKWPFASEVQKQHLS